MKRKVITRLCGGLGNQLFIYAAARRLALVNNADLVLDNISGFRHDPIYKRTFQLDKFAFLEGQYATPKELMQPFSRARFWLSRYFENKKNFFNRKYIKEESFNFDPKLLDFKVNRTVYLEGYWQSEKYFLDIREILLKDLKFAAPNDCENMSIANDLSSKNSVAIHVRFFNNPIDKFKIDNVTADYYINAINKMEKLVPGCHYYLFSDHPINARELLKIDDNRLTVISKDDIDIDIDGSAFLDMYLMSLCKHFIISNSTYSWWGAWLSRNIDKVIICPSQSRFNPDHSWSKSGLIPEKWIQI